MKKIKIAFFVDPIDREDDEYDLMLTLELYFKYVNYDVTVYDNSSIITDTLKWDILIFDWGGMGRWGDDLHSYSKLILDILSENPSKIAIINSMFSRDAIRELNEFLGGREYPNLILECQLKQGLENTFKLLGILDVVNKEQ